MGRLHQRRDWWPVKTIPFKGIKHPTDQVVNRLWDHINESFKITGVQKQDTIQIVSSLPATPGLNQLVIRSTSSGYQMWLYNGTSWNSVS